MDVVSLPKGDFGLLSSSLPEMRGAFEGIMRRRVERASARPAAGAGEPANVREVAGRRDGAPVIDGAGAASGEPVRSRG